MLNKKAQFGPDFIIATVIILVIGLGGVIFLQLFVGGLSMQGLLSIIDTESDQKCYGILSTMVADEYITTGENVAGREHFNLLAANYATGDAAGAIKSVRFEQNMDRFKNVVHLIDLKPGRITNMYYFMASRSNAANLRNEIQADMLSRNEHWDMYTGCSISVLGIYEPGTAELYFRYE